MENSSRIFELKSKLWQLKQGTHDVTLYYNKMFTLWQELDQCYDNVWENAYDYARHMKREEDSMI